MAGGGGLPTNEVWILPGRKEGCFSQGENPFIPLHLF